MEYLDLDQEIQHYEAQNPQLINSRLAKERRKHNCIVVQIRYANSLINGVDSCVTSVMRGHETADPQGVGQCGNVACGIRTEQRNFLKSPG